MGEDDFVASLKNQYQWSFIRYLQQIVDGVPKADSGRQSDVLKLLQQAKEYLPNVVQIDTLISQLQQMNSQYGFIIPDSGSRYLTDSDIADLTVQEINYAKNEIYARHGRKFNSRELQQYFNRQDWYHGTIAPERFNLAVFNLYEIRNVEFLSQAENARQPGGYQLDEETK